MHSSDVLSLDNSEAAFDFGGGVMFFGSHLGVRGDIRYFRTFKDVAFDVINMDNPGKPQLRERLGRLDSEILTEGH